ncbi:FHA domain-containing protein [Dactylosporangium sp. AC04546]|uniref:FHA domain-containing protein n=1 Tax=Dactylosporangium sp. AC04546 TaxID=2862460 RepID=UPI001EDDC6BA|nr:FHA domain-containing protein [Dactylosporangium sp. AC04546]WVK78838.1 FHA domain-containing protein [Dactylosporangium sp. AC04546]
MSPVVMVVCVEGHESAATDYCDVCGGRIGPAVPPAAPAASAGPCPECGTPRGGRFCEVCGHDFVLNAEGIPIGKVPEATPGQAVVGWQLVAVADRAHHARVGEGTAFPEYCPDRRFVLTGTRLLIGRRSRSRGIQPDVDLSGPPEDPGVSHAHAMLLAGPDGRWSVADIGSANGTYLNEATEPIDPDQQYSLGGGDRIHLGAWTMLTLQPPG